MPLIAVTSLICTIKALQTISKQAMTYIKISGKNAYTFVTENLNNDNLVAGLLDFLNENL